MNHYYLVDAFSSQTPNGPYGRFNLTGRFGQLAETVDVNGATTKVGYDEWGRPVIKILPLDRKDRPAERLEYLDAQCQVGPGRPVVCSDPSAVELTSPPRVTTYTWDDQLDRCKTSQGDFVSCADPNASETAGDGAIGAYRVTYAFSDGQVQAQTIQKTIQKGKPIWTVAGTEDFDIQGRVIRAYKIRQLPTTGSGTTDPCPIAGSWCDSSRLRGDPLRSNVATVQTAYDERSRIIRTYGPGVPRCTNDPSTLGAGGQPLCDAQVPLTAKGHVTRFEYPMPGVVRTVDARGVPSVNRIDVRGLPTVAEEYERSSPIPYATVRRTYDRLKRLVQTTDHQNNASNSQYDALGRVIQTTDPDLGETKFSYDKRGLLTKQVVATGDIARHSYDPLRRLTYSEYARPKSGNIFEIDPCLFQTRPCNLPPLKVLFFEIVEFGDSEFTPGQNPCFPPVGPRPPCQPELTNLPLNSGDLDNGVAELTLPFDITLLPQTIWKQERVDRGPLQPLDRTGHFPMGSRMYVNTNGKVRLDSGGVNDIGPATEGMFPGKTTESALYPYYDDLVLEQGGLRSAVRGTAPNRELVIQWSGKLRVPSEERVIFRTIIKEGTSEIRYEYDQISQDSKAMVGAALFDPNRKRVRTVPLFLPSGETFVPKGGTAITTRPKTGEKRVVLEPPNGRDELQTARLELSIPLAPQGPFSLSFRHRWMSRCASEPQNACAVDHMEVGYRDPKNPDTIHLLIPASRLRSLASMDNGRNPHPEETISVALPEAFSGRDIQIVFDYKSVIKVPADARVFWMLDHIRVAGSSLAPSGTQAGEEVEEKVWREYDSAESAHTTSDPALITDLTFDVPGRISDRSPVQSVESTSLPANVENVMGVSGKGITLRNQEIPFDLKMTPLNGLTIEAWVRPESYPANLPRRILGTSGLFSISLRPDGRLDCGVIAGGNAKIVSSTSALLTDAWTHIALSYDMSTFRCMINGAVEGQDAVTGALTAVGPSQIGDINANDALSIDEVRIYSVGFAPQRVLQEALRPLLPGPPKGNLVDIRFSEPGRRGQDASKANNHATLNGGHIVPGVQGATFRLNGGDVTIPHSATLFFGDAITAELWLKTINRAQGPVDLIGKWSANNVGPGWKLGLEPDTGRLRWEVRTSIMGPAGTISSHPVFVTFEQVNDDTWHHIAATYDGQRLRVFIDGIPAHRTCSPLESGTVPECVDQPPPDMCAIEISTLDLAGSNKVGDAVCSEGTIDNAEPVRAGTVPKGGPFNGMIDELRVSNYAKREFEIAASSRPASWYTQVLSREVDLRNELPVGTQIARERRAYDVRGEVVSTWKRVRGQNASEEFLARYADDTLVREGSREYPDGEVVVTRYDHSGLQIGLTGYGTFTGSRMRGRQVYLDSVDATITGRIASQRFGNGVVTLYWYDDGPTRSGGFGADLVKQQSIQGSTATLSQRVYNWDKVGNLESIQDPIQQYQSAYIYDDLNRIRSAAFTLAGQNSTFTYGYDRIGNLTLKEGASQEYGRSISAVGCGAGSTSLPHAITRRTRNQVVDTYCYDEAGRLVTSSDIANNSIRNLYYLARGKLGKLTERNGEHQYSYDGNGTRVAKTELGKTAIEPYPIFREIPNGTELMYSTNGNLLARRTGSQPTEVFWYHTDHLGGTNLMSDASGTEITPARSYYLPYGGYLAAPTSSESGARQFTGKELDGAGYYNFGARYYDPASGRFTQPDSIIPGKNAQALNRYSYVYNNPLKFVDPTGHAPRKGALTARHGSANVTVSPKGVELKKGDVSVEVSRDKFTVGAGSVKITKAQDKVEITTGPLEATTDPSGRLKKITVSAGLVSASVDDTASVTAKVEFEKTVEIMPGVEAQASAGAKATVGVLPEHDPYAMISLDVGWWAKMKARLFGEEKEIITEEGTLGGGPEGLCPNCGKIGPAQIKSLRTTQNELLKANAGRD
ncbi:MAG: LamG domain-containing protein [Nitrospira sp.]|nr:LamG domain-containing protein [Nitrospira sp.]